MFVRYSVCLSKALVSAHPIWLNFLGNTDTGPAFDLGIMLGVGHPQPQKLFWGIVNSHKKKHIPAIGKTSFFPRLYK